jgi:hypothetical protein
MDEYPENLPLIRRYLLGQTSEDEGERVEQLMMTGQEAFESALMLEDELADDYVQGFLSRDERLNFEKNYIATKERRQKVWFARAMTSYATRNPQMVAQPPARNRPSYFRWGARIYSLHRGRIAVGFGCVMIIMVVLSALLMHRTWALKTKLEEEGKREREILEASSSMRAELLAKREREEELQRRLAELGQHQDSSKEPVELLPGISRGEGSIPTLLVPKDAKLIEIDLKLLHGDYQQYRIELYDRGGREIAMQDMLRAVKGSTGRLVPFKYPAKSLAPGDYRLQLKTAGGRPEPTVLGNYYFRIKRPF